MAQLKLGTTIAGNTAWHSGNDGTGSGLDADLLDGLDSLHYLNYNNLTNKPTVWPIAGTNGQMVYINGGIATNSPLVFYDNVNQRLGIGTSSPTARLELAETWNNVATTFTHIKSNVIDTTSATGSLLMDLQVGSLSKFRVGKDAQVSAGSFMIGFSPESTTNMSGLSRNGNNLLVTTVGTQAFNFGTSAFISSRSIAIGPDAYTADVVLNRDAANILAQRNGINAQTLRIYNTFTDASNYERGIIAWNTNVLDIGTEAAGTGTRRQIKLNYTTTIDGASRTNVPALTISNVGAGNGGLLVGQLQVGYQQDWSRLTAFYTANKALAYNHGGGGVANQGAHRFSTDATFGSSVGANGSVVDILAPTTLANIFQCRQNDETIVLNVAYNGTLTIANTVSQSVEATTLATVTKTQVASFPAASFRSGKLIVQAYDSVTGEVQISELLVAHNGTTASATEYGVVFTGTTSMVIYDVDITSGNVRLMATRTTANSTQYKTSETLMVA